MMVLAHRQASQTMTEPERSLSGYLSRLTLRVDPLHNDDFPALTILIDGQDVLSEDDDLQGFPPEMMLIEQSPLLPVPGGRRVGVYLCGCGIAGCAVSAPWIERDGDQIVWTDFRNYVGVFHEPIAPAGELRRGVRRREDTFRFSSEQYVTEVARAVADQDWRTPRRRTVDLVNAALPGLSASFADQGLDVHGLGPSDDGSFTLWAATGDPSRPPAFRIDAPAGGPEAQASWILNYLRSTPAAELVAVVYTAHPDDTDD